MNGFRWGEGHDWADSLQLRDPDARSRISPGKVSLTQRMISRSLAPHVAVGESVGTGDHALPPRESFSTRTAHDPFDFSFHSLQQVTRNSSPIMRSVAGHPPTSARDPNEIFGAATRGPRAEVPFRAEMEHSFGEDFSGVTVHFGQSQAMAELGAHAATQGETVAFATSHPGKELVAHELTHVVQNRRGGASGVVGKSRLSSPDDASEREADTIAARVVAGERVEIGGTRGDKAGGVCSCNGAGCATCNTKTAVSPGPGEINRSIIHRFAGTSTGTSGSHVEQTAIEQLHAVLAGPAKQMAQRTGSPTAASERTSVIDQMLSQLAHARTESRTAEGTTPAAEHGFVGEALALVSELQAGFSKGSQQKSSKKAEGDEQDKQSRGEDEKAKAPVGQEQGGQPKGGVIQRQVANPQPPFDCNGLLQQIIDFVNVLKQRSAELIADVHGLQWNHWSVGDAHPEYGSVEGHQEQFRGRQQGLRNRLNEWNTNNCGGPPGLPADAWDWATRPAPNPTPRPNPAVQRAAETVAVGVGAGVGLYVAYRVVRMIPSLFPPLWWTIPANAAVP